MCFQESRTTTNSKGIRLFKLFRVLDPFRYAERRENERRRRAQSSREEDRGKEGDLGETRAANVAEGRTGRYNRQNQLSQ